jgi:hypothetical protein
VTLSNLAASALGRITLDRQVVATFMSDPTGAASASFTVPAGTLKGAHPLTAVDLRSRFPATATLVVVP